MATQLKLADVESALITTLNAALSDQQADIQAISPKNVDADGNLVLRVTQPTVLVIFESEALTSFGDNVRTSYNSAQVWGAICFDQSLRSPAAERAETFALTSKVRDAIAGQRLSLSDSDITEPMLLLSVDPFQFDLKGTWYIVRFQITDSVQFTDKS